ncbi:MAG: hypothetical protein ACYDCK_02995 [Thermoplasmatota archaeon]
MATDLRHEQKKKTDDEKERATNASPPQRGMQDRPHGPLGPEKPNVVGREGAPRPIPRANFPEPKSADARLPDAPAQPRRDASNIAPAPRSGDRQPSNDRPKMKAETDKGPDATRASAERRGEQQHSADDQAADEAEDKEEEESPDGDEAAEEAAPEAAAEAEPDPASGSGSSARED